MASGWVNKNSKYMLSRLAAKVAVEIKCSIIGEAPDVIIVDLPGDNGRFYYDDNVIKLDPSLAPYHQRFVLAHELAHYCGIWDEDIADKIGLSVASNDYLKGD